ncbi:hypothetical protein PHG25ORF049c [Aeromonas phage 25]|uniref:Uncharacterized protein n=1 Tax=Aeromonas phage 25 TaxID=2911441 RepID=Q19CW7_9CAUD|nr:hypothetical protein PHG25ORF049c [Aeromonas phage 25]ABF72608.1 hypothetical protein PHG25ORF049c [Aeromonas phage 25]
MKLYTLSAIPAAGKTAAILNHIVENNEKAIIASISRQLSKQSFEYYVGLGGEGELVDTDNRQGQKSVHEAVIKASEEFDVIFITHAALMGLRDIDAVKRFYLYIDEVPELTSFERFTFTTSVESHILELCKIDETGLLELRDEHRKSVQKMAIDGFRGNDDIYSTLFPLYKALLTGVPVRLSVEGGVTQCYYVNDASNDDWAKFKSITVCSANFEQTFTGMIMKHFNGWEFEESPLVGRLAFRVYPKTARVKIHVMFDDDWSRYKADKEVDGISNYTRIENTLDTIVNGDFIYTRNSYRPRMPKGTEVPYNPHGLNNYSDYTNVVVMFSYNPAPWQVPILKELAKSVGLDESAMVDAYIVSKYLEPAFQLCARCDIRNEHSLKPINLYVPDMKLAQYMLRYLPHAEICDGNSVENHKQVKRNRESYQALYQMTEKERFKYKYLLRKLGRILDINSAEDQEIVQDWIIKTREKAKKKAST